LTVPTTRLEPRCSWNSQARSLTPNFQAAHCNITTTAAAHREHTLKIIGDNVLHFLQQRGGNNVLITKCDHETPPQQTQSRKIRTHSVTRVAIFHGVEKSTKQQPIQNRSAFEGMVWGALSPKTSNINHHRNSERHANPPPPIPVHTCTSSPMISTIVPVSQIATSVMHSSSWPNQQHAMRLCMRYTNICGYTRMNYVLMCVHV
jgi:hypothetical protein